MHASEPVHAFADLLRHRAWVRALARRLVRDEHEAFDLEQETWLAALKRPAPRSAPPRAWLATVLRRVAARRWRSDRRRDARERKAARPEAVGGGAGDLIAAVETHERLVHAVLALDEPFRTTLLLRFYENLPPREIARRMDTSAETARARVRRGLQRLRGMLDREHRGGRRGWQASLTVLLAPPPAAGATTLGGVFMTSTMLKVAAASAVIGLGVLFGVRTFAGDRAERAATSGDGAAARAAVAEPGDGFERERAVAEASPAAEGGAAVDGEAAGGEATAERKGDVSLGGFGEMSFGALDGAGGGWLPEREAGAATLMGVVVDARGLPVAGADVYRLKEGVNHEETVIHHFGKMDRIARTDAQGAFRAEKQEGGAFLLTADVGEALLRASPPWGLDTSPAIPVELRDGATVAGLRVQLPFALAALATVKGEVVDDRGKPVPGALVTVATLHRGTDASGEFRGARVRAGEVTVRATSYGYKTAAETVQLADGETRTVRLVIEPEATGTLAVSGRVVDASGRPVGGIAVYLNTETESIRVTRTAEDGAYAFERLPKTLREIEVMCSNDRTWIGAKRTVSLPADNVDLVLTKPLRVNVRAVSKESGEPVTQIRGAVLRDGEAIRSFHLYHDDPHDLGLAPGAYVLKIEAPGHDPATVEFACTAGDEPRELRVELVAVADG